MTLPTLLVIPNVSEGRSAETIRQIAEAAADGATRAGEGAEAPPGAREYSRARLLDVHSDRDHHRSVFTLAATPGPLAEATLRLAAGAIAWVDVMQGNDPENPRGQHPHVGAL